MATCPSRMERQREALTQNIGRYNGDLGNDALAWLTGAKSPCHQQTWTAEGRKAKVNCGLQLAPGRQLRTPPASKRGRPPGRRMRCGWRYGAQLTARNMRTHFTICAKGRGLPHLDRGGRNLSVDARLGCEYCAACAAKCDSREPDADAFHRASRMLLRLGLGLRSPYRPPDARALHYMPDRPAASDDVERRGKIWKAKCGRPAAPDAVWLGSAERNSRRGNGQPAARRNDLDDGVARMARPHRWYDKNQPSESESS